MKFETLIHSLLLFGVLFISDGGGGVNGQSWSSNYQSYNSQKDVNKSPLDNNFVVDPVKNSVDGVIASSSSGHASLTEVPRAGNGQQNINTEESNVGSSTGGGQSMYYYEMYPSSTHHGNVQPKPQNSRGRQLCSYTASGAMRCQPKSASFYPNYEVAASNSIPHQQYYMRPGTDNRQGSSTYGMADDSYGVPEMMEEGEMMDAGGIGGSIGGLAGLLGLLGLKGLKPILKGVLAIPLLAILSPILLPIILLPLLLLLLPLLLFIPIPVIVTPGARSLSAIGGLAEMSERALRLGTHLPEMAMDVFQSEECVERISCEIARVSRKLHAEDWMNRLTSSLPKENKYTKKILDGIHPEKKSESLDSETGRKTSSQDITDNNCSLLFTCNARSILAKHLTKI